MYKCSITLCSHIRIYGCMYLVSKQVLRHEYICLRWEHLEKAKVDKRQKEQQTKFTSALQSAVLAHGGNAAGVGALNSNLNSVCYK